MSASPHPIYCQARDALRTVLAPRDYRLVSETHTPATPAEWGKSEADFRGPRPPVTLSWDGAYRFLAVRAGELSSASGQSKSESTLPAPVFWVADLPGIPGKVGVVLGPQADAEVAALCTALAEYLESAGN